MDPARSRSRSPFLTSSLNGTSVDCETVRLLKKRYTSLSGPREGLRDGQATELRAQILHATSQLSQESQRATNAEQRTIALVRRLRESEQARISLASVLTSTKEELRLYKLRYEDAQTEIDRAQKLVDDMERERADAERRAIEQGKVARRLREARLMGEARQEGRRDGLKEGLEWARRAGFQKEPVRLASRPQAPSSELPAELVPIPPPRTRTPLQTHSPIEPVDNPRAHALREHAVDNTHIPLRPRASSVDGIRSLPAAMPFSMFVPTDSRIPVVVRADTLGGPIPQPGRSGSVSTTAIHATQNAQYIAMQAPRFRDVNPPPEGFIPPTDEDGRTIALPHPHALRRHPSAPSLAPPETSQSDLRTTEDMGQLQSHPGGYVYEEDGRAIRSGQSSLNTDANSLEPYVAAQQSGDHASNTLNTRYSPANLPPDSSSSQNSRLHRPREREDLRRMDSSRTSSSAVGITIEPPSPHSRRSSDPHYFDVSQNPAATRGYLNPEHSERPLPDPPLPQAVQIYPPPVPVDPSDFDNRTPMSGLRMAASVVHPSLYAHASPTTGVGDSGSHSTPSSDYFLRDGQLHRDYTASQPAPQPSIYSHPIGAIERNRTICVNDGVVYQTSIASSRHHIPGVEEAHTDSGGAYGPDSRVPQTPGRASSGTRSRRFGYEAAPLPVGFAYPERPVARSGAQATTLPSYSSDRPVIVKSVTGRSSWALRPLGSEYNDPEGNHINDRDSPPLLRRISMFDDTDSEDDDKSHPTGGNQREATPSSRWSASPRPHSRMVKGSPAFEMKSLAA